MKPIEVYVKSCDDKIIVEDVIVSGRQEDAYVEDVNAYNARTDEAIEDPNLLEEIAEHVQNEYPELVEELAFEADLALADDLVDRMKEGDL